MGERMSFLHLLLDAGDISTMLDRFYYKKRIFAKDKELYASFITKTQLLEKKKGALIQEKARLAGTIQRIESYQEQLNEAMHLDKMLVEKLKTSREAYEMAENQLERESMTIERQIMSMTSGGGAVLGSTGRFMAPVGGRVTSGFGYRVHPIFRSMRFHSGIDFGVGYGTPIRAADGGRIITAGWQGGYGKVVIINHGSRGGQNLSTLYGHMSSIAVGNGQQVSKGQVVGYVGSTGFSTGAHLHFEVRLNGRPVNPLGFLR
jgi:murein DD-endopeptidase MepM/ murein hydrolase activator NlpD